MPAYPLRNAVISPALLAHFEAPGHRHRSRASTKGRCVLRVAAAAAAVVVLVVLVVVAVQ